MVTLWVLSMSIFLMSGVKTSSLAILALSLAKGSSNLRISTGSPLYNHAESERSMRERPRGKLPVLFSRMANSMELTDESMAAWVNPSSAILAIVSVMSDSTLGMSSLATPLRPIAKVGCLSSSSRP